MMKGFTLIEVLISIILVGFTLVAMIEMFTTATRGGESADNLATATNLAQERIEEIRHLVQNGTTIDVGTGTYSFDDFDLQNVVIVPYLDGNLYLTELNLPLEKKLGLPGTVDRVTQVVWAEGDDTYKKAQVTVFWHEKEKTLSTGLVSYIRE